MAKHTPGPWEVGSPNYQDQRAIGVVGPTWNVADVYYDGADKGEAKANARLIAAAPELLRCLEWAMIWLPKMPLPDHDQDLRDVFAENLEECNRAIAKSQGRTD